MKLHIYILNVIELCLEIGAQYLIIFTPCAVQIDPQLNQKARWYVIKSLHWICNLDVLSVKCKIIQAVKQLVLEKADPLDN